MVNICQYESILVHISVGCLWCFAGKPNSFVNIVNLLADPVKICPGKIGFLVDIGLLFGQFLFDCFLRMLYFRQQGSEEMDLRMNTTAFWKQKALMDTTPWTVGTVICQMN